MKFYSLLSFLLCLLIMLGGCAPQNNLSENSAPSSDSATLIESQSSLTSQVESALSSQETAEESDPLPSSDETSPAYQFSFSQIPAYSGKAFTTLNSGQPVFSQEECSAIGKEEYSPLDSLGRCGKAFAVCGTEIMPNKNEERGSISHIKPSGWVQAKYDTVSGKYLFNRCHLLGWQLSAENDNARNLITGTRYMNTEGMLPFENMIADYIKETENHVAYRVTPRFQGNELVARGVELEAYSLEDDGDGICFHVYVYNVQPEITIDYLTGNSKATDSKSTENKTDSKVASKTSSKITSKPSSTVTESKVESKILKEEEPVTQGKIVYITPTGKRYHYSSTCGGKNSKKSDLNTAKSMGLTPCKKCAS